MEPGPRLKTAVKNAVKQIARIPGLVYRQNGARILTYHSVGRRDHEMNVRPTEFRWQMEWLKANYPVISLQQAAQGTPGVAITFDDGYLDNYLNAFPTLNELDIPATFFIVAGKVGTVLSAAHDPRTSTLMSWKNILEMNSRGFEIGCHTMTHPHLAWLDSNTQHDEIVNAKDLLEDRLSEDVLSFAYPYGSSADFNQTTIDIVRAAGFTLAASNQYGVNTPTSNPFALKRIWIDRTDTQQTFKAKIQGRLDSLALLDSQAGTTARRILNKLTKA